MKALRIKGWEKHYENNRSRELKRPEWLPLPNKFDGTGFMELLDHPAGMSHYGAWCLLLGAASRQPVRGLFVTDSGKAMSIRDIARMTRGSAKGFEEALPRLLAIGWVEEVDVDEVVSASESGSNVTPAASGEDAEGQDVAEKSQPSAGFPQRGATMVRLNGKGNGKEKKTMLMSPESGSARAAAAADPIFGEDRAPPDPIAVVRDRTLGDLQALNPKIYVGRDERGAWQAVLDEYGWEIVSEACRRIGPAIPQGRRILLSILTGWIAENVKPTETA